MLLQSLRPSTERSTVFIISRKPRPERLGRDYNTSLHSVPQEGVIPSRLTNERMNKNKALPPAGEVYVKHAIQLKSLITEI